MLSSLKLFWDKIASRKSTYEEKRRWINKVIFVDEIAHDKKSINKCSMRIIYRKFIFDMLNAGIKLKDYKCKLRDCSTFYVFFNERYVELNNKTVSYNLNYKEFFCLMQLYVDNYLNNYWCTSREKNKMYDLLSKLKETRYVNEFGKRYRILDTDFGVELTKSERNFKNDFYGYLGGKRLYVSNVEKNGKKGINRRLLIYINKQLNYDPLQPLISYDLKKVKNLNCAKNEDDCIEKDLIDLKGIEKLENLEILIMPKTKVKDFSRLNSLRKLKKLSLKGGEFEDLSFLSNEKGNKPSDVAKNLFELNLSETHIDNFTPLRFCTNLVSLKLNFTEFHDLEILRNMTKLKRLYLVGTNNLINLNVVGELKKLEFLCIKDEFTNELRV